jgi:hypothetical protein
MEPTATGHDAIDHDGSSAHQKQPEHARLTAARMITVRLAATEIFLGPSFIRGGSRWLTRTWK